MKKIIFLIALILFAISAQSQTLTTYYYDGGISYGVSLTTDSTKSSYTSNYFDWSRIDGTTLYLTYSLVQAHYNYAASNDTFLVIIKGRDGLGNTRNIDTFTVISNTTQALASSQTAFSLTGYLPEIAFYFVPKQTGGFKNGNAGLFKGTIYGTSMDAIYTPSRYQWNR